MSTPLKFEFDFDEVFEGIKQGVIRELEEMNFDAAKDNAINQIKSEIKSKIELTYSDERELKDEIKNENIEALERGIHNLMKHVENLQNIYGLNVVVAINKYTHDTQKEIDFLREKLQEKNVELSLVESWEKGGEGAIDLAEKIMNLTEKPSKFNYAYELEKYIKSKIKDVACKIYGATDVEYTDEALEKIKQIEELGYGNLPVCIAKTQYSLSDDQKNLECLEPFNIHVQDVILKAGAEFIVVITGKIMTMPGLPRVPSAENIDLDENGNIIGIF